MRVISIGTKHTEKFVKELKKFKNYTIDKIGSDADASIIMPEISAHEDAEKWADTNVSVIKHYFKNIKDDVVTFVVSQNFESGIMLVLLQVCKEEGKKVQIILIRRDFGINFHEKLLARVLFGVLYEFLNTGIDCIYYFYYDVMRAVYKEISLVNDDSFYNKIALLWHKKNVFLHKPSFLDLTGEVKWSINQIENILALPKLILLTSAVIPDNILSDLKLDVYKMVYHISSTEEKVDENIEDYVREVSHVVREFKLYSIGEDRLFELFVKPNSGVI
jgi:hypothetical protein